MHVYTQPAYMSQRIVARQIPPKRESEDKVNKKPMRAATRKEQRILAFIRQFLLVNAYLPTGKEIAHGLGYPAVQWIEAAIDRLVHAGFLERQFKTPRSLRLTQMGDAKIFDATAPLGPDETLASDERTIGRVDAYIMDGFKKPRPDFFVHIDDPDAAIDLAANDLIAVEAATSAEAGRVVIGQLGARIVCRRVQASQPNGEALQVEGVVLGTLGPRGIER